VKRRTFITLLGGVAAWPLAAHAQQPAVPVIGYLSPTSFTMLSERLRGLHQGLKEAGYVVGENVTIEYRWSEGQYDRLPAMAAELVRKQVSVIVAGANAATFAAKAATTTIPIVFLLAEDPVQLGLVASLARPGGNATGINFVSGELTAKRMALLHELVPAAARVAVLVNPADATATETTLRELETAVRTIGLNIQVFRASTSGEIHAAFPAMVRERSEAIFLSSDPFFSSRRVQLATLAARHAIPLVSQAREIVEVGGLMSYGAMSWTDFVSRGSTSAASSRAQTLPTCLSCSRASSSWSSTPRPPGYSASPSHRRCSPAPTR
jgi:putative ABC transport system substrate-binding protein